MTLEQEKRRQRRLSGLNGMVACLAFASALGGGVSRAHAQQLIGRITFSERVPSSDEGSPHHWDEWNGRLPPRNFEQAAYRSVLLALVRPGAALAEPLTYEVRGGNLWPTTLAAAPGSDVKVVNRDAFSYELYASDLDGFGPLQTASGRARTIAVPPKGTWRIQERNHPHVQGHLLVVPGLVAVGAVNSRGQFTFAGLGPGSYDLLVFRNGEEVLRQSVQLHEREPLELDALELPRTGP